MSQINAEKRRFRTVADVAKVLGVSKRAVQTFIDRGEFKGAFKAGRDWRIPAASLDRYIADQQRKAARSAKESTRS